ncbi:DNA phosphorothioation system sulfurtransferase DndC [Sneathiella sp.]|uniref:DNA phosphorothioation system sulfurtransferase DndC n=1 Tax=Sneathiella sp. TaxID=1964365 RepID=UPI00261EC7AE|nr:DNA phosphorothioation system sulfurtransferase DndC [Sneathiella sp.]MDF2366030.1 DNA phosphorothioation system sulfurtransferase DndC [Sneathiella sp.]
MASKKPQRNSAFSAVGFKKTIEALKQEIVDLYLSDEIPWVVGYSGGKDSTAVLQLVWLTLADLPKNKRSKPVYVISTDTLVENPVVSLWVSKSLDRMSQQAANQGLPLTAHKLTPAPENTFWVNLIGRGYPAPRPKFRWCTERLKINPSTQFINSVVQKHGEAILVLGTRKAESAARAKVMERFEQKRVRNRLSPNGSLPNSYVYSPIEDWSNDDVWLFLMQVGNPWGYNNKDLLTMYQGASADGECPLVVDTTTPSCGDSRFGCWVCTLVEKDKSMHAMIQNDEEKEWMLPLLELRNRLDPPKTPDGDRPLRDFRRMNGAVQLYNDRPIPGPYKQKAREMWLRQVLEAQQHIRENGPDEVRDIELITLEELEEIRRVWVVEKHEIEDDLPRVYEDTTGNRYPGGSLDDNLVIGAMEMELLRELCSSDELHFQLVRELLSIEKRHKSMLRRAGLYDALESSFYRNFYEDEGDAVQRARVRRDALGEARERAKDELTPVEAPSSLFDEACK